MYSSEWNPPAVYSYFTKEWSARELGQHNTEKALVFQETSAIENFQKIVLLPIEKYGIDGDYVESQAFAYLAIRSFLKLPISFPGTTGCKEPTTGGVVVKNF